MLNKFLILFFFLAGTASVEAIELRSFEIYEGDTINIIDDSGKKQGFWIIFSNNGGSMGEGFSPQEKSKEGHFRDNRKVGLWKSYFPGEILKSEVSYQNGRAKGPYIVFYPNGQVQEKGIWEHSRNVGEYMRWHPNGKLAQEFVYDQKGKRSGIQRYFYPSGKLEVEVKMENGLENGDFKRFYPTGELKEEMNYVRGSMRANSHVIYPPKKTIPKKDETVDVSKKPVRINEDQPNPVLRFVTDGYNKLYNRDKQLSQDGLFKDGKLWTGQWYRYNEDGILLRIEIYKAGAYIGNGPIEAEYIP